MTKFSVEVDTTNRQAMVDYLKGHFRYYTMNSWNGSTSYAHDVKLDRLDIPRGLRDKAYAMLESGDWQDQMSFFLRDWDEEHGHEWQVGVNGRSGGYLVLYQGGVKDGHIYCTPGKGLDGDCDFTEEEGWDIDSLRERVGIVQSFDKLADDILAEFMDYLTRYNVEEVTVMVPKQATRLVEVKDA